MKTGLAIALPVASLFGAGLAMIGQPGGADSPQLAAALLPPLLDQLGRLFVESLQWLAIVLQRD